MLQFFPLCSCQQCGTIFSEGVLNNKICINIGVFEAQLCYKTLNRREYVTLTSFFCFLSGFKQSHLKI